MSKVTIAGDAVVVASSLKLEDIKTIKKYRPNELVLKGGDDGKEPIFAIDVTTGDGNINSVGASFDRETNDGEHLACVTLCMPGSVKDGDVKAWVADTIGGALVNLNKLEEKLPSVLSAIAAEKQGVLASINIAM